MSEKETSPREVEPTAAKSTTREVQPTAAKSTPPPPKPDEESPAVKRALLFMYWVAALLGSDYVFIRTAHRRIRPHRGLRRRRSAVPHEALRGDDQGRRGGVVLRRVILPLPFQNSRVLVLYKSLNSRQGGSKISVNRGSLTAKNIPLVP